MKSFIALVLLTLPISVGAQSNDWWKMGSDKKPPVHTESSNAVPIAPNATIEERIKRFRNNKRFSVTYDKFRDTTHLSVGSFYVEGKTIHGYRRFVDMSAHFFVDKSPLKFAYLRFGSSSRDWQFLKSRELLAIIDGERMEFGEGDRDSNITRYGVSESLIFSIPLEQFIKIIRAANAELKVGNLEVILKAEHKEAFRDLLSLTQ